MITYMFWRVRLWLAGAGERLRYNMQDRQARRLRTDRVGRFDRLVDPRREDWDAFAHGPQDDEPRFFSPAEEIVALQHFERVRNGDK